MERRKVQRVGGGTYTVSLPKSWAESEGLATGSVVDIHTHLDGLLVVQAREPEDATAQRVTIPVDHGDPERLERTIRAAYAAGSRRIVLVAESAFTDAQQAALSSVARGLVGVTVAEESDERATLRTLLDPCEVSIRQSVRQLLFVALSMHRDATAALAGDAAVGDPSDRDDQVDRAAAMIARHFDRAVARLDEVDALGLSRPDLFDLYATARELERVADDAERIAEVAASVESPPDGAADEIDAAAEAARTALEESVGVVVDDADPEAALSALEARDEVRASLAALDRRLFEADGADYRLTRALDSLRRTTDHAGAIAETGLKAAVRDGELSAAEDADAGDADGRSSASPGAGG